MHELADKLYILGLIFDWAPILSLVLVAFVLTFIFWYLFRRRK